MHFLMKTPIRFLVLCLFGLWFCSSIASLSEVDVGLEQDLSVPDDSYMMQYFDFYNKYFVVGPNQYFVITEGFNYTDVNGTQRLLCTFLDCSIESLPSALGAMAKIPER